MDRVVRTGEREPTLPCSVAEPPDRPIVHFTHIDNLAGIMADGYIKADTRVREEGITINECAETSIKERRRSVEVPVAPYGAVSDYVPFYFANRSPMLFSISKGNVSTYSEGQEPLIYFWSHVSKVIERGLAWVGSDGNCAQSVTVMTNDRSELEEIVDWPVMKLAIWKNTQEDGDRRRRRMAEFLVHEAFPVDLIQGIVTMNESIAERVRGVVPSGMLVHVRSSWYF